MVTVSDRTAVWDAWLECEYQRLYWQSKAAQFSKRDRNMQIGLALLSSSAVLSALGDIQQLWLWKILSFLTAAVATVQPFLNYTRDSAKMCNVALQWHQLEVELESMWRAVENGFFSEDQFRELRNKTVDISKSATELPFNDPDIQLICQNQVLTARGLK